jgi:chemosensory pili system protein ChpA (sensor histidine kinase/response regulator)
MDTQILDALAEPLMHLLKNAVVHGIESPETRRLLGKPEIGEIVVTVSNEETHVVLTIADDGRGIALSAIREKAVSSGRISQERAAALTEEEICDLIFLPGLTTAEKLNLSAGRGVGMSIVKKSLESHRGQISIESHPQKGTVFSIRVPLTLAVTNALMVRAGCQTVAIPIRLIDEVSEHTNADVLKDEEFVYVVTDDGKIPLRPLAGLISSSVKSENTKPYFNALRIKCNGNTTMVAVDDILRTEEVVIKSLGRPLDSINGILGAAILGNGELVPILDMPVLLNTQTSHIAQREIPPEPTVELNVMIVDDSPSVRHMSSKIIANAGWVASTAIDGIDAIEKLRSLNKLPDIILSDIEMPRMDGYELVATLRRSDKFAKIPVIMVTSRSGDKHREKAIETGVSEYLTKPYDEKELISMIERLVHVPA